MAKDMNVGRRPRGYRPPSDVVRGMALDSLRRMVAAAGDAAEEVAPDFNEADARAIREVGRLMCEARRTLGGIAAAKPDGNPTPPA